MGARSVGESMYEIVPQVQSITDIIICTIQKSTFPPAPPRTAPARPLRAPARYPMQQISSSPWPPRRIACRLPKPNNDGPAARFAPDPLSQKAGARAGHPALTYPLRSGSQPAGPAPAARPVPNPSGFRPVFWSYLLLSLPLAEILVGPPPGPLAAPSRLDLEIRAAPDSDPAGLSSDTSMSDTAHRGCLAVAWRRSSGRHCQHTSVFPILYRGNWCAVFLGPLPTGRRCATTAPGQPHRSRPVDRHLTRGSAIGQHGGRMANDCNTAAELAARFATEAACRDYLVQLRWPDGFRCPHCGGRESWRLKSARFECRACHRQT